MTSGMKIDPVDAGVKKGEGTAKGSELLDRRLILNNDIAPVR